MSLAHSEATPPDSFTPDSVTGPPTVEPSFLETFVSSFFQEKNIKWILVIGASIVFGSSLMLVTKAWPHWTPELKYLSILGYTTVIFAAGEYSRRRLRLHATYRVLQALTLTLLPICFLALTWLSSGTAVAGGLAVAWHIGLMIPAIALLWYASSTVLDHWLRGRQTTFLLSFNLLCIAGAMTPLTTPGLAFAFMAVSWLLFTAGVVKVNRHTFWLAEEHQLPRIFGFLPIGILGLQFVVLVSVKSLSAVPLQWIGFTIVMVAATVLLTTRTVADVFRRRSGDLVRPLPWAIVAPLFIALVLIVLGLGLAFSGFSYTGTTTYAIIPTAIVACVLFACVARDTRHSGFVWAALIALTITYQCSPTLFSNLVQTLRSATAQAINQERVPLSMYGLTYMPLLGMLVLASRRFARRQQLEFSRPLKHFATVLAGTLFGIALMDVLSLSFVSPLLVAAANSIAFMLFAILLQDRRYVIAAIFALVVATATAIPGLNQMDYTTLSLSWVPSVLSGLALAMTTFSFPDRLIERIPAPNDSKLVFRRNKAARKLVQGTGCLMAIGLAAHWIALNTVTLTQPLSQPSLIQYVLLLAALLLYTIRTPQYLSAASIWVLVAFASIRWAIGTQVPLMELITYATWILAVCSALSGLAIKFIRSKTTRPTLQTLRQSLGWSENNRGADSDLAIPSGLKLAAAFTVSLFDLSVAAMSILVAVVYVPCVLIQHLTVLTPGISPLVSPVTGFGDTVGTGLVVIAWLIGVTWVCRVRSSGLFTAMLVPVFVTSVLISMGLITSLTWVLLAWTIIHGCVAMAAHVLIQRDADSQSAPVMRGVSQVWLLGLLILSSFSFELPIRLIALIALPLLGGVFVKQWRPRQLCGIAIIGNVNLLLLVAGLTGCSGWMLPQMGMHLAHQSLAYLFLVSSVSVLVFDHPHRRMACDSAVTWAATLRIVMTGLFLATFAVPGLTSPAIIALVIGLAVTVASELHAAILQNRERHVWIACLIGVAMAGLLFAQDVISIGSGMSQFVLLGLSVTGLTIAWYAEPRAQLQVLRRPLLMIGHSLPGLVACLAILRAIFGTQVHATGLSSLSLMIAAGIYFHQAFALRRSVFLFPAVLITNAALALTWHSLGWHSPELYLVPVGLSVLVFVELMKKELPEATHNPLRYIAALTILCSPLLDVLGGSWLHMFVLMLLSVLVIFAAIGLRICSLMYAGSAFLLTDLVAMVIRSTIHNVTLLWISGVVFGIVVIVLAALCENHREKLLSRIRLVSAELATWN